MKNLDLLRGKITKVIDEITYEIEVISEAFNNTEKYHSYETVKMFRGIGLNIVYNLPNWLEIIQGKEITVLINSRDMDFTLLCSHGFID